MSAPDHECYTDFALQEYVQGRLDPGVRQALAEHIGLCEACRAALQAFETEATLLRETLRTFIADAPGSEDLSDEMLARYSGGGLSTEETARMDSILTRNPEALVRLIALARETRAAQSGDLIESKMARPQPAGEILRMPKRIAPPSALDFSQRARGAQGE